MILRQKLDVKQLLLLEKVGGKIKGIVGLGALASIDLQLDMPGNGIKIVRIQTLIEKNL